MARPNKYITNIEPYLKEIQILNMSGIPLEHIAKMLGIADSTLRKHKNEVEEFSAVYKKTVDGIVKKTENAMYDLAWGNAKELIETKVYDGEGNLKERRIVNKTIAPDKVSQFFILTNMTDTWKHKAEVSLEGNDNIAPTFKEVLHEKDI
jgi:hypothetical protein